MSDDAEETFLPVMQTINSLSQVQTKDHKALVIRLELSHFDYAKLEDLVKLGIATLAARKEEINTLILAIRNGSAKPPKPLNENDIIMAYHRAIEECRAAEILYETIKRPPPR